MKTLGYALSVVVAVLLAGSFLGGVISLVWLLAVGEWRLVAMGLGLAVATILVAPLLLLPARLLVSALPAAEGGESGRTTLLSFLANAWAAVALVACLLAILWLLFIAPEPGAVLPAAVWSYAVATLPWIWLAYRQDQASGGQGGGAALMAVTGMASYAAGLLSSHYADLGLMELAAAMLLVLGLAVILNTAGLGARERGTSGPEREDQDAG